MKGEMISFKGNGKEYCGYLAPSSKGKGPGIIVIQEWWGLVDHIKKVADRFAQEGFTALAPDFYQGETATGPDTAGRLMMAINIAETEKILQGAISALLQNPATTGDRVGVVGFCMGGQLSLYAATLNPKIGACVDYYGIHPNVHPDFSKLHAPVLGFFAELDQYVNPHVTSELSNKLKALGKEHEFITYPKTQHAFFNDTRPEVYNREAAEDSWKRMIDFFKKHLQ
jgi:carboxymethylenebutenolidase